MIKATADLVSGEEPLPPGSQEAKFLLCSHMVEGTRGLSLGSGLYLFTLLPAAYK
jgi:hypothetical protein